MAVSINAELITQLYIGFYNRAPDPVGLQYWSARMEAGTTIQDIGNSFAASPEASETYPFFADPGADVEGFLSQVYLNVFGRAIDADGLEYYSARLEAGEDAGSVVTSIVGNAATNTGTEDQAYIQNKVDAGLHWSAAAATSGADIYDDNGRLTDQAVASSHGIIGGITADPATVEDANNASDNFFGEVPATVYGDLEANVDGNLYAGAGNPADGFVIGKDASGQIELGLDVRYANDGAEVAPTDGNVFHVDADNAGAVRFAYSASGIDLVHNDYTLEIDTDPGIGTQFETFKLVADETPEDGTSHYDWVRVGEGGNIIDDGGDAGGTVTQNIEAIQWFNDGHGIQGAERYDVNLTATDKDTGAVVAETGIVIQSDAGTQTLPTSGDVAGEDGDIFAGHSNPNTGFTTVTSNASGIELGLAGWNNPGGAVESTMGDDGLVHYALDDAESVRFAYSVESQDGDLLSANTFRLSIDTDGSEATNYQVFELANLGETGSTAGDANISDSLYQWNHMSGDGPAGPITDDGGDIAGFITQNIQKVSWFDSDVASGATEPGHYDIMLEAFGADGVTVVGVNHIVLDIAPPALG